MQRTVHVPDGRLLAIEEAGDPAGWPVLVHHGTPSSRTVVNFGVYVRDAAERGARLIGYDRPGYGESSPQPGRTVADTAADVRVICAELGIDRLATWGHSGGGAHALACAALLPELVTAAAALAALAPFDAEGLDYFAGMGQDNVDGIRGFLADEATARVKTDKGREEILAASAEQMRKDMEAMLSPADAAAMDSELDEFFLSCTQAGLSPGSQGWWDDNCAYRPWGFDVASIAVPVLLLNGRQDMFVPPGHGDWLAKHIPGATARLFDEDGHGTIVYRVPEVHAWLEERR